MPVETSIPLHETPTSGASLQRRDFAGCAPAGPRPDAYDALLARLRQQHVPYSVLWELTHRCNLKCLMCYNEPLEESELTTQECLDILAQLARAGTLRLTLTGGEILARPDFFVIAEQARRLGFVLDLKTNATIITSEIAGQIARLAPLQVDVSLLGASGETFDALSGVASTFERVMRGVRLLHERGVRVKLNTLLMNENLSEQRAMVDVATELGVYYEQVFKVSPTDSGRVRPGRHQLLPAQMMQAVLADQTPYVPQSRSDESRTCSVGLSSCMISPYGVVYPCIELRIPAGDLRKQPFADIWGSGPILTEVRERHVWRNLSDCRTCVLERYCEGRCAGIAWKDHGDLYGGHVLACWQAQARYAQQHPGERAPETQPLEKGPVPSGDLERGQPS